MTKEAKNYDVYYQSVRKALQNGNAAIMVGAGFSRNAENGDQLATWADTAKELWRGLNPNDSDMDGFSAAMVTQLGEQYARVFSKPALEEVLKRLIPDDRVSPGRLHNQLLQLPWSEIFTTNYDTLLERAAEDIVERAHFTVVCREDIPQSKILNRRRIVKLHGSFPSQRPFVFTEDDYRTYPDKFSPFVNLVRQSLLENVFCLIGFSGDDPNFLNWIGWVRDMLDRHALPIYLFLGSEPSLGQRALLEARQVTPVILPLPDGVDKYDYATRFEAMFKLLQEPLAPDVLEWGNLNIKREEPSFTVDTIGDRLNQVISNYSAVAKLHSTYPGWMVCPASVRRRLQLEVDLHSIENHLQKIDLRNVLSEDRFLAVIIFSEYAWIQETLLQCLNDGIAMNALELLVQNDELSENLFNIREDLFRNFMVTSASTFKRRWLDLALSLLRWARQGLRRKEFELLKAAILFRFPKENFVLDEISHEAVLFALYDGDRDIAGDLLKEWKLHSSDGYMFIRRGLLLSEVGEFEAGLASSLQGLQQLRRNQKSHPNSTRYLSEEAWACLAIRRQQQSSWLSNDQNDTQLSEQIGQRLIDLASKGFDVRREVEILMASLNSEATHPSEVKNIGPAFDLGNYSTQTIFSSSDFREKIHAAFGWLTVSDRAALVPRIRDSTYDMSSFAQAAWWAQFADSTRRILGVLIRTMNNDVLKPRNPDQPPHKTGWLSRFQVGCTEEELALHICEHSLSLVERTVSNKTQEAFYTIALFHMEIFSRLVIRITSPERVVAFAERMIELHYNPALANVPKLWRLLGTALARCFEALSESEQERLVPLLARIPIPDANSGKRFSADWLPPFKFGPRGVKARTLNDTDILTIEIDKLISMLVSNASINTESVSTKEVNLTRVWATLFWLDDWGLLSSQHRQTIQQILWLDRTAWPVFPGFYPWAAYQWQPDYPNNSHHRFKDWILKQQLPPMSSPGSIIITHPEARRRWGLPARHDLLVAWIQSLKKCSWSEEEVISGLTIIKHWWDGEWEDIRQDMPMLSELEESVRVRFSHIDGIFSELVLSSATNDITSDPVLSDWIDLVLNEAQVCNFPMLRYRFARALADRNVSAINRLEKDVVSLLLDFGNSESAHLALRVVREWIQKDTASDLFRPILFVDCIAGIIAARRMPLLYSALNITIELVTHKAEWFSEVNFNLVALGLEKMLTELAYDHRPQGTGIPDDDIPNLRFACVRLVQTISRKNPQMMTDSMKEWLDMVPKDPLPEIRFIHEREI